MREAIAHNLTLVAERYSVGVAQARILAAGLRPNPVFTYSAMIPDSTIFDFNVNPFENVFRGDFIIEGGGKRERRIEVAEQAKSVAELQFLNTMRTILLDVQSAFVDVLLAKENLALARGSLNAFNELVKVNADRVRTGDPAPVELARSRLAALQFQNDVRQQESKLTIARTKLKTVLGRTAAGASDRDRVRRAAAARHGGRRRAAVDPRAHTLRHARALLADRGRTEGAGMTTPVKLLLIFVNEADTWENEPLYQAIVQRLRHLDLAGATAQAGIMGFGRHHRVHHKGLFGIPDDRPITITVADEEAKLRAVLPEVKRMVREGLMLLVDAEVVADLE